MPTQTHTPVPAWQELARQREAVIPGARSDIEALPQATLYDIDIYVHFDEGLTVTGTQRVAYWNNEEVPLSEICFRLYPNTHMYNGALDVSHTLLDGKVVTPQLSVDDTVLCYDLDSGLLPGERIVIEMDFQTAVPRNNQKGYRLLNYASDVALLSNFHPMIAVYDDEGWNIAPIAYQGDAVYSEVSFYQVNITAPQEMVIATSGSEIAYDTRSDGMATRTFVSGPARDFAVALSTRYQVAEAQLGDVKVRSFYLPQDEKGGRAILKYALDALAVYGKRFGPYPYAEFDIVEAPIDASGVEFPGLIMIKEERYSLEDGYTEFVVAHEVAHQWWYGLVGNDQPDEPWVDEALANYSTVVYYEDVHGHELAESILLWYFRGPYQLAVDAGRDMPATLPASAYPEYPSNIFYRIIYAKGGLFYHELRQRLGDERFFAILREYFGRYRYGVVSGAELLGFWRDRAGQNIDDLIQRWLLDPAQ